MLGDLYHGEDIAGDVRYFGINEARDREGLEAKQGRYYCGKG
jgi:hypothetical protein